MLSPRREIGEFKKRYKWMALVAVVSFAVLFFRMMQLQLVETDHWRGVARENITKTLALPATRGVIRDSHGRVIAANRPSYNVFLTPQIIAQGDRLDRFGELMGQNDEEREALRRRIEKLPARRRAHQIQMFTDVTREQLAALEQHASELPGVDVVAAPVRSYPYGTLGAHAVGYLNEVSAEDLERLEGQGYGAGDVVGRTGIESAFESFLRGRAGFRRLLVDAEGRVHDREAPAEEGAPPPHREPQPGRDLTLTLDMELMRIVERAFRGHPSGAAVVVDVNTGRVRALFSKPSYDLNEMSGRLSSERFRELMDDPFRPLIDKTLYESYFPGSTFKPIAALAALEEQLVDPTARVDCPGYYQIGHDRKRCTQAHGEVDMRRAMVQSCNVYFFRLGEQVGLERLNQYAREFGFGDATGVGINHEADGFLSSREWYVERFGRFRIGDTLNVVIGQGNTRGTLLQIAVAYAAIANGGRLYIPQIIERISAPDGAVIEEFPPRLRRRVDVAPEHLAYVVDALYGVVNDPDGTGFESHIDGGVPVAGKTGTAQVAGQRPPQEGEDPRRAWYFRRDHAWFAGFAPAGAPEVSIVVLVEHGGPGGRTAAPIAMQILQEHLGARQPAATTAAAPPAGSGSGVALPTAVVRSGGRR
jgi:penicillin-binding protein 2